MIDVEEDLTPAHLRCTLGACPAIFKASDGEVIVVGKTLSPDLLLQLKGKVGADEYAVKLSAEFFRELFK
jgi:hypothetical protein